MERQQCNRPIAWNTPLEVKYSFVQSQRAAEQQEVQAVSICNAIITLQHTAYRPWSRMDDAYVLLLGSFVASCVSVAPQGRATPYPAG